MRTERVLACAGLSLALIAPGCLPVGASIRMDQHFQTVTIRTEPRGATVYRRDGDGLLKLGRFPVTVRLPYNTVQERTDKGACGLNGAGQGLVTGLEIGSEVAQGSEEFLAMGAIGLVLGAVLEVNRCSKFDTPAQVQRNKVEVLATLPGHLPERRRLNIPRASSQLTLFMVPNHSPPRAALIPPMAERFAMPPDDELRPVFVPPSLDRLGWMARRKQPGLDQNPRPVPEEDARLDQEGKYP